MANNNTHIIAKHFLHLAFPEKEGHFQRQERISKVYWDKLVRKMSELFDRYVGPDEIIRVDSLQIDLGRIRWKKFDDEFVEKALEQLELSLIQLLQVNVAEAQAGSLPFRQDRFQQWLFFLEKGAFDWRVSIHEEADFHRMVLDSLGMESSSINQLSSLLNRSEKAFDRLIFQHKDSFLKTLVELYTGVRQEPLPTFFIEIRQILDKIDPPPRRLVIAPTATSSQLLRLKYWKEMLTITILERRKVSWDQLVTLFLRSLVQESDWPVLISRIRRELTYERGRLPQLSRVIDQLPPVSSPSIPPTDSDQTDKPLQREEVKEEPLKEKNPLTLEVTPAQKQEIEEQEISEDKSSSRQEKETSGLKTKPTERSAEKPPSTGAGEEKQISPDQKRQRTEEELALREKEQVIPPEEIDVEGVEDLAKAEDADALDPESPHFTEKKDERALRTQQPSKDSIDAEVQSTEIEAQEIPDKRVESDEETPLLTKLETSPEALRERAAEKEKELKDEDSKKLDTIQKEVSGDPSVTRQDHAPQETKEQKQEVAPPEEKVAAESLVPKSSVTHDELELEGEVDGKEKSREQQPEKFPSQRVEAEEDASETNTSGKDPSSLDTTRELRRDESLEAKSRKPPRQLDKESGRRYKPVEDQPVGTSFYVFNAGVVILHPFLGHFFKGLELVNKEEFVDDQAQQKAIHLIQYLATRETELPEYELLLPKLLCNLPFDIPIEREVEITPEEMTEGEKLLEAVIQHWGALGSSTPDALREGFLQRQGKLEKRKNGWYLRVEQKTLDILLGKLPWGLGMVKLPWMPDILRVEWT